ncbi:hypothetical protein ACFQO4_20810 [Saliphagus sp. GCM10025334]
MSFERVPDELRKNNLAIRCMIGEDDPDLCDGWLTSVEIDPSDVRVDGYDRLHFAEHVPTECPECGDRVLEYNGVEVTFHA